MRCLLVMPSRFSGVFVGSLSLALATPSTDSKVAGSQAHSEAHNAEDEFLTIADQSVDGPDAPVAIFVQGEVHRDIDGNALPYSKQAFDRQLAQSMAANGVTVVRYSRLNSDFCEHVIGVASPEFGCTLPLSARIHDLQLTLDRTIASQDVKCVWLAGHSFGAFVATQVARDNLTVCGVILLGALAEPYADNILRQMREDPMLTPYASEFEALFQKVESKDPNSLSAIKPPADLLFHEGRIQHIAEAMSFDMLDAVRELDLPVLVVTGERDRQTPPENARKLHASTPNSELLIIDGVDHYFTAENERSNSVAPQLAETISEFIHRKSPLR